jgi:hypothetical protein
MASLAQEPEGRCSFHRVNFASIRKPKLIRLQNQDVELELPRLAVAASDSSR